MKKLLLIVSSAVILVLILMFTFWEDRISGFEDYTGVWSVGFNKVENLNDLPSKFHLNIIDSANSASPVVADFVADPFFIKDSAGIHLFVEHAFKDRGDITYFFSKDLSEPFKFVEVVLDEPFHLSYPQVFEHEGRYYMLPETQVAGKVILYSTDSFPRAWQKHHVLMDQPIQDPTLLKVSGDEFYLFGSEDSRLHCWKSTSLLGPYELEATNLLIGTESRPGGRIVELDGKWIIPIQNSSKGYGTGLSLYEIHLGEKIRLKRHKKFFLSPQPQIMDFSHGMHHLDMQLIDGEYYIAYDGNNIVDNKSKFNWKVFLKFNFLNFWNEIVN